MSLFSKLTKPNPGNNTYAAEMENEAKPNLEQVKSASSATDQMTHGVDTQSEKTPVRDDVQDAKKSLFDAFAPHTTVRDSSAGDRNFTFRSIRQELSTAPPAAVAPVYEPGQFGPEWSNQQLKSFLRSREAKIFGRLEREIDFGSGKDAIKAAELWLNYARGKPAQALEVSGPDGSPIQSHSTTVQVKLEPRDPERTRRIAELLLRTLPAPPLALPAEPTTPGLESRDSIEGKPTEKAIVSLDFPLDEK